MKKLIVSLVLFYGFIGLVESQSTPINQSTVPVSSEVSKSKKLGIMETQEVPTKPEFQKSQLTSETISLFDKFMNLKIREKQIVIGTIIFCLVVFFGFLRYFITGKQ